MNRLKAMYRSWAIPCTVTEVVTARNGSVKSVKPFGDVPNTAASSSMPCGSCARSAAGSVVGKQGVETAPPDTGIGPIRGALLMALIQTTNRFRTKRQLWTYSNLRLETHDSAQHRVVEGQLQRSKKPVTLRGLNKNHNHDLKAIFKSAATRASSTAGPFRDFYEALLAKGRKPTMARLTLIRKIAAITLIVWKKEVRFDADHLKQQAA